MMPPAVPAANDSDEDAEHVEAMPDARHGAAQGEYEGPDEVECQDGAFPCLGGEQRMQLSSDGSSATTPRCGRSPRGPASWRAHRPALPFGTSMHDRDDRRHDHQEVRREGEDRSFANRDVVLAADEGQHAREPVDTVRRRR